jgi:hypothetical protein
MASIAEQDKRVMDLQALAATTKKNIGTEYHHLMKNVKENPYLEAALHEYKQYFDVDNERKKKQIKALKQLFKSVPAADQREIQREIKRIESE